MSRFRPLAALALICAFSAAGQAPAPIDARLLEAHNQERARLGVPALTWNATLARDARKWAQNLAQRNAFEHAKGRVNQGENLWRGTSAAYQPEQMIGAFISEKAKFRAGRFPDVSRTGRWSDVSHFTQLIWPGTREVGCALASGHGFDVLVCRYAPAGNIIGQAVP